MNFMLPFNEAWIWLVLVVLFIFIETSTTALITVWFAIGAGIMIFVSFLPIPFVYQIVIFLAISILLLVLTRPILAKKLLANKEKTNVDSLIGKKALVVKTITQFEKGEIKVNGLVWSAQGDSNDIIEQNSECTIVRVEGVTAIVTTRGDII